MSGIKHLVTFDDLTKDEVINLVKQADGFSKGERKSLEGKVVANLFFEPSTRTKNSFVMAQKKLGVQSMEFDESFSSTTKGETLYDTVKAFEAIGVDGLVIRHPDNNYFDQLIPQLTIPILNGGDGSGNHPSQSLLDLLTIWQEFGRFEGLKIAIVGDVVNSRVAHTNVQIMERLGMEIHLVAPEMFQEEGYVWHELDDILEKMDVVMLLRIQHERHQDSMSISKEEYHMRYGMSSEREKRMKEGAIIMHPGPINHGVELADGLMECGRSRVLKQIENGVYARMAIINRSLVS